MAEIAGLVLGAIPLLISALEHYETFVEPTVAFFQWRGQLPKVTRRLWMGHTAYEQNVRLLLAQALSSEHLDRMVNDPHGDDWKDVWLVKDLEEKLGHAYQPTMSTIREIADIMVSVAAGLNIEGSDKITQDGLEAIVFANPPAPGGWRRYEFRKRVVFTLRRRAVKEKLDQLDECNQRLSGFLEKAAKLDGYGSVSYTDPSSPRLQIRFGAPLDTIRHNVSRVHRGLLRSWCRGHSAHEAGLLLEQRLVRRKRRDCTHVQPPAVGSVSCFGLCILLEPIPTWLDTEFNLEEDYNTGSGTVPSKVPRVTFSASTTSEAGLAPESAVVSVQEAVTNICSKIQTAAYPLMAFSLDSSDMLRGCFQVRRTTYQLPVANSVSLGDYLPKLRRDILPYQDFYALAITLVCSVLHLGGTPWLRQPWSRHDIRFPCRGGGIGNGSVDVQHPYLIRRYPSTHPGQREPHEDGEPPDQLNLLALAVMLLELNTGAPLENRRALQESSCSGEYTTTSDLLTAKRLLDVQVQHGRLSCGFRKAITYCLQGYLDPTASFSNPEFVKTVEERVLEPLEREMQVLLYGS